MEIHAIEDEHESHLVPSLIRGVALARAFRDLSCLTAPPAHAAVLEALVPQSPAGVRSKG